MGIQQLAVGDCHVEKTEPIEGGWRVVGVTKDLTGELIPLDVEGETLEAAQQALEEQAWCVVFAETKLAINKNTRLLELVDMALSALRTGEVGRGNRIQTVNMYEHQRPFLKGERGVPGIGKLCLWECTHLAIHSWLSLVAKDRPTSARIIKILLLHAFELAMRQGLELWSTNPARTARVHAPKPPEPVEITTEEFYGLLARVRRWEASGKRTDLTGILCMLMGTGMRPGEVPALRWEDVDLESSPATVTVTGCAVIQDGKLVRQPEPKTAAGYREITIPEWLKEMLLERQAKAAPGAVYVFPSEAGTMLHTNNIATRFRQARGKEYAHIKLKSFRSTVATRIAREKGAEEAARHLGHTSPSITGRHYIKRARQTGNHNDVLEALDPRLAPRTDDDDGPGADGGWSAAVDGA